MHSAESSRRSHRRRPDLNINTSTPAPRSSSHGRDAAPASPPLRKPPVPSKGSNRPPVSNRALRVQPPPASGASPNGKDREFGESFLDNDTPIDTANKENEPDFRIEPPVKSPMRSPPGPNYRDSHDLSLPARQVTRDSLVTNMLMSLDKMSLAQIHTPPTPMSPFDEGTYGTMSIGGDDMSKIVSGNPGRPARAMHSSYNHGHGYSYSSDLEGTDDAASRVSSQFSRGRRSNSSSGFQSGLGRINSMRETSSPRANTMVSGRAQHSRGGKTSKSSSTNSFDAGYAHVLSSQRISHGIGGRSPSFDYQPNSGNSNGPPSGSGPWNIEFSNSLFSNDYEVAPNPTVPGGPRRPAATVLPPAPPPVPKDIESGDRKRSLRSRGSTTARAPSKPQTHEMPPLPPVDDLYSAPAPNVGYEKSKTRDPPNVPTNPAPQAKERPGFFRRVFGGSSKNVPNTLESSSSTPVSATSAETVERQNSTKTYQHIAGQMKTASNPPSRDSQHSLPHVVQKKSSFFRRRKKSITDTPPLPQPPSSVGRSAPAQVPIEVERTRNVERTEESPVSSLRQVMIPYLKGSTPATPSGLLPHSGLLPPRLESETISPEYDVEDGEYERRRKSRGFSPDYEPSPNATIRTVKSHSALNSRSRESVVANMPRRSPKIETPNREPPDVPSSRRKLARDTFFEDNSDTDGDKPNNPPIEQRLPALLSPADYSGLPGGFPSPPSTTPRDSPRPPITPEPKEEFSFLEATSPSLLLQHNISNEEGTARPDSLGLPIQSRLSVSPSKSATSGKSTPHRSRSAASIPSVQVENANVSPKMTGSPLDEPEITVGEPTEDDVQKAQRIFDGNEDFIQKDRAAAWMGEEGLVRQRTLRAYIDLYDFAEKSVLTSLREICDRLILRAETQQIDRILVTFSRRWCDCNPNHGFKAMGKSYKSDHSHTHH